MSITTKYQMTMSKLASLMKGMVPPCRKRRKLSPVVEDEHPPWMRRLYINLHQPDMVKGVRQSCLEKDIRERLRNGESPTKLKKIIEKII